MRARILLPGAPIAAGLVLLGGAPGPASLSAQQYVVDDAEMVDEGACHVEAWHGRRASWLLPACQPVRNLELAAGVGFVDDGDGRRETEYALEAKTLLRPLAPDEWGVGLVVGVGPNPSAAPGERRFGDVYAFVPASASLADDRVILHGNLGWEWDREGVADPAEEGEDPEGGSRSHHLTWGVRSDLGLAPPLTFIAELHAVQPDRPEYQLGFRLHRPEAGLEVDLSWGRHLDGDERGAGPTVGVQIVSGQIFGIRGESR